MLDHAKEAVAMAEGKTRQDLETNRMLNLALVRLLEIVGEAANRVPKEEQMKHPAIPWKDIAGMRNRIIHGYDRVDTDILWEILEKDLPPLVEALEKIVPPEDAEP
jgi:uncharacterized protein with HEPN domain